MATSGVALDGVSLVRGAEGGYARWTRGGGGPYDGLLLSTANVFAPQLHVILELLAHGRRAEAAELSGRIEAVVCQIIAGGVTDSLEYCYAKGEFVQGVLGK